MGKLLYSVTMSLDGFIAGPGGDMSWMTPYLGPNPMVDALINDIGALLVGGRTFSGDDPHRGTEQEGKPFGGGWSGQQIVLTRRPPATPIPDVTFVADVNHAITAAKAAAGEKYVNVLGATTARLCLEAGQLDEVLTLVAPIMLGDGVRLFSHPGGSTVRLERISLSQGPLATNIWMRVLR